MSNSSRAAVEAVLSLDPKTLPSGNTETSSKPEGLYALVKPLASLSASMLYLAEAGNDRLNINQAAFFLIAAAADVRGAPLTLSDIMQNTEGVLNRSLYNTYRVLLEGSGKEYKKIGLGWLRKEPDPDDERRSYLRLTRTGLSVARAALLSLGLLPDTTARPNEKE